MPSSSAQANLNGGGGNRSVTSPATTTGDTLQRKAALTALGALSSSSVPGGANLGNSNSNSNGTNSQQLNRSGGDKKLDGGKGAKASTFFEDSVTVVSTDPHHDVRPHNSNGGGANTNLGGNNNLVGNSNGGSSCGGNSGFCWGLFRSMAALSLVTLVLQNSCLVLMTRYSRFSTPPKHLYHTSTLVFSQECLKMVMCLVVFGFERRPTGVTQYFSQLREVVFQKETVKLIVPAALFTFQNFLIFVALTHLDAMMFQVISQTKLLSAAVFSVMLLSRRLNSAQWFTLLLLTVGVLFSQLDARTTTPTPATVVPGDTTTLAVTTTAAPTKNPRGVVAPNQMLGVITCVVSGLSSSFAGVYFEKVVKTTAHSLAVRNIHLSVFGIPFALLSMLVLDIGLGNHGPKGFQMWRGFDRGLTWALVLVHALGGLLVAMVVKYADNILKGFATGVAIILSGVFAAMFWNYTPGFYFIIGCFLVIGSSIMYHYAEPQKPKGGGGTR